MRRELFSNSDIPVPGYCRICMMERRAHPQVYTHEDRRDEIPEECKPKFHNGYVSESFHFYVPITMAELKTYLLRKRNDKQIECDRN